MKHKFGMKAAALALGTGPRVAAAPPDGAARIALVERPRNPLVRLAFRESRRRSGTVMDPLKAFGHHPTLPAR